MRSFISSTCVLSVLLIVVLSGWANGFKSTGSVPVEIVVERFENPAGKGEIPPGWFEYKFRNAKNPTRYDVIPVESSAIGEAGTCSGDYVLRAVADSGSSLIGREISVDLHEYPVLSWEWKVESIIPAADGRTKEGNDFPARIYVAVTPKESFNPFRSLARGVKNSVAGMRVPKATINFVWSSKYERGVTFDSPSSDTNKIVVVEGGETHVGKWMQVRVNVLDYYKRFFPGGPGRVDGIALMSDSDDTQSRVVAYYDDIVFSRPQ